MGGDVGEFTDCPPVFQFLAQTSDLVRYLDHFNRHAPMTRLAGKPFTADGSILAKEQEPSALGPRPCARLAWCVGPHCKAGA